MQPSPIVFNRPSMVGNELRYMREAVEAMHISGDGPFTQRCARLLEKELGVAKAILTTSCTDALEMCGLLVGLQPGDQFIVPSFSFVSTVNAFVLRGAVPVFADIREDTLNLDESQIESRIGPRTKAVVLVHYAGVACAMDAISAVADKHGLTVIEDNAHGLFAKSSGRPLGTFGPLATLSFHETKNFQCGEGGALLINDERFVDRAAVIRDKGTDRQSFFRGLVDKYTWVDVGSSFVLSDLLAAYLYAQLEARAEVTRRRRAIWQRYDAAFRGRVEAHEVRVPFVPEDCEQAHHMYYLILPSATVRQALGDHLQARGIMSVFHYTPLHRSRMAVALGGTRHDCPVTDHISDGLLRLPFYYDLSPRDQDRVIEEVHAFFDGGK